MTHREEIRDAMRNTPAAGRARVVGKLRARAVADAFRSHHGRMPDGSVTVSVGTAVVRLASIVVGEVGGHPVVDVYVTGATAGGDPHYRIFNPPTLAATPGGGLIDDPVLAIACVIAANGGTAVRGRKS